MNLRQAPILFAALLALLAPATFGADEKKSKEVEEKIALDQLPAAVKKAAEGAVKGLVIAKAEKVTVDGSMFYEVEGKAADGKEYEVKVSPDGKVMKVEQEDGDDDDGDDDDDDDDDDKKPAKK
jgi:hypothetical protein